MPERERQLFFKGRGFPFIDLFPVSSLDSIHPNKTTGDKNGLS